MVEMSASLDGVASAAFDKALKEYGASMGDKSANAPKIAALYLCDSLRARTRKAKKKAPRNEWRADYSPNPPKYITYRRGEKLIKPLVRWSLTRKLGTPDQYTKDHFIYVHTKNTKRGNIVKDRAAELRELKEYHLGIFHAGLAKVSWNKVKEEIKTGASSMRWPKRKRDAREPLNDVRGHYRKDNGVTVATGTAVIKNHLDYIESALYNGALSGALDAAAKKLMHNAGRDYEYHNGMAFPSWGREMVAYAKAMGRM